MSVPQKFKLYYCPGACSLFIRIALIQGGFENVEYVSVDLYKKDEVLSDGTTLNQANPNGYVPALVIDDTELLTEASVIALYLVSLMPEKFYFPETGIAKFKAMSLLNYITTEIHKTIMLNRRPEFPDDLKEIVKQDVYRRFGRLETILDTQPYLIGDQYSIVDGYAYNITLWTKFFQMDFTRFPNITNWQKRIEQLEFVQQARAQENITGPIARQ